MNELTTTENAYRGSVEKPQQSPTVLSILDAAVRGGITADNMAVVEKLVAMRREELAEQSKAAFAKAFFKLRKAISTMDIYADKVAKTDSGAVAYRYCSETEISKVLEPLLFKHEFVMLFGQKQENERTVVNVTLIHEAGHQETREYAVRSGATNRMKDATAADTGATTSAWRHLMIKMFGIKSRIREDSDARNEGDPNAKVTPDQADELERRVKESNSNVAKFLQLAGALKFSEIPARNYDMLDRMLCEKERGTR